LVIPYPPDWTVDESQLDEGAVYFRHPTDAATWLLVATGQRTDRTADELRDERVRALRAGCRQGAIDLAADDWVSGILFRSVGMTCDLEGELHYAYVGVGLQDSIPWRFELHSLFGQYSRSSCRCEAGDLERYFGPMLEWLTIYTRAQP
jgi:hypothetical protein